MKRPLLKLSLFLLVVLTIGIAIPLRKPIIPMDYSQSILAKDGELLRVFLNNEEQWCLLPADSIPQKLKTAVLLFEDEYFYYHPGINPISILRAIKQNLEQKHVVSGASTIDMQIARMKYHETRTFRSKLKEMIYALKLDLHFRKESILSLYLNHAPYGGNIIGYRAASLRYFQKKPHKLSWAEASLLAILPNSPGNISPTRNNKQLKQKRDRLLKKLWQKKKITTATYQLAVTEPIPNRTYPFTIVAPHLTQRIHREKQDDVIETTIDYKIQRQLEFTCRQYSSHLQQQGIHNLSALVIDNKKRTVVAYIGSQYFFDLKYKGMVDGIMASRSSGSILKPFLYALSFDQGLITPQTILFDIPTYFDAFAPNNANEKFSGVVKASYALQHSLNVPAVRLLNRFGVYQFYNFLKEGGVSTLFRNADNYGLPLIIGGAETNPFDIAQLYCGLANGGLFQSIHYLKKDTSTFTLNKTLISKGASYQVLEILKDLKRPGHEANWQQYNKQSDIAWKTGTSYGHKDAWATGCNPDWTVVVWAGNFDGESNVSLSGMASAGPLFFDIMNQLNKHHTSPWFTKNQSDFKTITLCSETGFVAGPYCPHKTYTDVPKNMAPLKVCHYHSQMEVNEKEDRTVCSLCWDKNHHQKSYLIYPPEVNYQLKLNGIAYEKPPQHKENCSGIHIAHNMDFIYPKDSSQIWLPRDFNGDQQKVVFKIAHQKPSSKIYWYLDDSYLGTTQYDHKKVLSLTSGWHQITVNDNLGETDKINIQIMVTSTQE